MAKRGTISSADEHGIAKRFDFGSSVILMRPASGRVVDVDALLDGLIESGAIGGARRNVARELLAGRVPRPMGPWGLLVRLVGQPWTYLVGDGLRYEWPRELASKLQLRTAFFFANGLIGRLEAQAYEGDRLLVEFLAGPGEGPSDGAPSDEHFKQLKGEGIRVRGSLLGADWIARQKSVRRAWEAVAVALDAYVPMIWHGSGDGAASVHIYAKGKLKPADIERIDVVTFGPAEMLEPMQASRDLSKAIRAGNAEAVRAALAAGASAQYLPDREESPLIATLQLGLGGTYASWYSRVTRQQQLDVLRALLEGGANPNPPGGGSAIGEVMDRVHQHDERTHIRLLDLLIKHGADVNAPCDQGGFAGWRPLSVAAHRRTLAIVKFLLARGADPHLPSGNGKTPREQLEAMAAITADNHGGATASDVLAVLRAAEAGGAERAAAVMDWPDLAEASYQAYAAHTRAKRRQSWLEDPKRMRALDEYNGGPRYDTLDGDEPAEIVK